eukprot:UN02163
MLQPGQEGSGSSLDDSGREGSTTSISQEGHPKHRQPGRGLKRATTFYTENPRRQNNSQKSYKNT